ncbi:tyrosine-type recombinase/integrase [Azohydromonas caseinilytica]|uniref:Tyrosine-type recombinase/integrase n=1 Tax=Azohydromonas caseinilytica TaxID=2728836 RepID=A0A848F5J4_9BURK|nr:tyrosine-type recombinase/integrase [Azohydromonas caseinilytica]NML13869.1 tyrosine-type recombinase/integrase [Azohydromonas caseinilytica]
MNTVAARDALPVRRDPYWQRIEKGRYVGYRRMSTATPGTWLARFYDEAAAKNRWTTLGALDHLPASERFDAAQRAAREWFEHLGRGGSNANCTVRYACERYVEHLRHESGGAKADEAAARFRRYVYDEKLAGFDIKKLTATHLKDWRRKLAATPVAGKEGARRADATLNRDMASFRAALNLALADGLVTSPHAWEQALRPIPGADGRRDTYLDPDQRRRLVDAAQPALQPFLKALCALPLRPGALAQLNVSDFNPKLGALRVGTDKAGADRRIPLPAATVGLLIEAARDKLPQAPLFADASGRRWDKDSWKWPIKAAVSAAGLPESVTAYTLRHSVITDLVSRHGLDLATVAALAGTSVEMIAKHYAHLQQEHARNALAQLTL